MKIPSLSSHPQTGGFTLVEMLVGIAIVATLVALGVPAYRDLIQSRTISAQVSAFSSSVRLTQAEAIKRKREVSMCRSESPNDAAPTCAGQAGDWATGWLVFEDSPPLGVVNGGDTVVAVQGPMQGGGGIQVRGGNNLVISFQLTGLPAAPPVATIDFKSKSTAACDKQMRTLIISNTGRTRLENKAC